MEEEKQWRGGAKGYLGLPVRRENINNVNEAEKERKKAKHMASGREKGNQWQPMWKYRIISGVMASMKRKMQ